MIDKKITFAIIRTSSIGDVVLATSCLNLLRSLKLTQNLIWIGANPSIKILEQAFPEVTFLNISHFKNSLSLLKKIKHLDFIVDLQGNLRSKFLSLIFQLFTAKKSYSISKSSLKRSFWILQARLRGRSKKLPQHLQKNSRPQFLTMLTTLQQALCKEFPKTLDSSLFEQKYPKLTFNSKQSLDIKSKYKDISKNLCLAIAPGASYKTKQAQSSIFITIIDEIINKLNDKNLTLIFLGDKNDESISQKIIGGLKSNVRILDLTNKLSLLESSIVVGLASCLIANDSSLIHIAESQRIPVCCLFGPTVESFGFAPYLDNSRSFSSNLGCRPCSKHGQKKCRYNDKQCFQNIDFQSISEHAIQVLNNC